MYHPLYLIFQALRANCKSWAFFDDICAPQKYLNRQFTQKYQKIPDKPEKLSKAANYQCGVAAIRAKKCGASPTHNHMRSDCFGWFRYNVQRARRKKYEQGK